MRRVPRRGDRASAPSSSFPDREQAHAWYASDAYQQILALRTGNSKSDVVMVAGVGRGHLATDVLEASR